MAVDLSSAGGSRTPFGGVRHVTQDWTSDAGGDADAVFSVNGELLAVEFCPGTGGVQPDNSYDVTLTDEYGVDVLAGMGADLSNVDALILCPGIPFTDGVTTTITHRPLYNTLTLAVRNAGNAKEGAIRIYYR